jgi:O-antigen/teichoic acid export membrane protein
LTKQYWNKVAQVSGGTILGQILSIVGYLMLTKLFTPAVFGVYALWLSIVMIGAAVCAGALETSLVRECDGESRSVAAVYVLWSALLGAFLVCLACGVVLTLRPEFIPGDRLLTAASLFVGMLALASLGTFQCWAAAEGQFRFLTLLRIAQSTLITGVPLGLSFFSRSSETLIWGHAAGLCLALCCWGAAFPMRAFQFVGIGDLIRFWKERSRCFKFVLPAHAIGTLAGNLPQLVINWRFGSEAGGYLALAQRVLGLPLSLVGNAVRDVFKRYASVAYRDTGNCSLVFRNSFFVLSAVALTFGVVMFSLSTTLFVLVFGEQWRSAGVIATWLLPLFVMGVVTSPLTYIVYIVEREDFDLVWQGVLLCVTGACLILFSNLQATLVAYAWTYAIMYIIYLTACDRFARGLSMLSLGGTKAKRIGVVAPPYRPSEF